MRWSCEAHARPSPCRAGTAFVCAWWWPAATACEEMGQRGEELDASTSYACEHAAPRTDIRTIHLDLRQCCEIKLWHSGAPLPSSISVPKLGDSPVSIPPPLSVVYARAILRSAIGTRYVGSKELFRKVDNENWIGGPRFKINLKQDSIGSVILEVYIYIYRYYGYGEFWRSANSELNFRGRSSRISPSFLDRISVNLWRGMNLGDKRSF